MEYGYKLQYKVLQTIVLVLCYQLFISLYGPVDQRRVPRLPEEFRRSDADFNLGFATCAAQTAPRGVYVAMGGRLFQHDQAGENRQQQNRDWELKKEKTAAQQQNNGFCFFRG